MVVLEIVELYIGIVSVSILVNIKYKHPVYKSTSAGWWYVSNLLVAFSSLSWFIKYHQLDLYLLFGLTLPEGVLILFFFILLEVFIGEGSRTSPLHLVGSYYSWST